MARRIPGSPLYQDSFERFGPNVAAMDQAISDIETYGLPCTLRMTAIPGPNDHPRTFCKIVVDPDRGYMGPPGFMWLDLSTLSSVASAPTDYHISLCSREEMNRGQGYQANRAMLQNVRSALEGHHGVRDVHYVSERYVVNFSWNDAVLGPVWGDLVTLRRLGIHQRNAVTMSM